MLGDMYKPPQRNIPAETHGSQQAQPVTLEDWKEEAPVLPLKNQMPQHKMWHPCGSHRAPPLTSPLLPPMSHEEGPTRWKSIKHGSPAAQ